MCILYLIYLFYPHFVREEIWAELRGPLMVILLKFLSFKYNQKKFCKESFFNIQLCYFDYLFNPGTIIYGPWFKYKDTNQNTSGKLKFVIYSFVYMLFFLTISSCMELILLYGLYINILQIKWIKAYIQGLSFRSSHYFICFLSQVSYFLGTDNKSYMVTSFSHIEFPRSLIEVCYYWNVPISIWLKQYVFQPSQIACGSFCAVILTYIVSSLLHGFDFRLSAVLLSLAVYTYVEYVTRKQISYKLDACVQPKPCHDCKHLYKKKHWVTRTINLLFTLLAVLHLTYLGAPFGLDLDVTYANENYDYENDEYVPVILPQNS